MNDFTDSTLWVAIWSITGAVWCLFVFCDTARQRLIPGSRDRYRFATAARATAYPAALHALLASGRGVLAPSGNEAERWLNIVIAGMVIAVWLYHFRALRLDGDDDWFKRTRRRVTDAIRSALPGRSASPAPA